MSNPYRKNGRPILNLYLTAGYPDFPSCVSILQSVLNDPRVDMLELGMPYSDPLADGPVIQETSNVALANGMDMQRYFDLLDSVSNSRGIPILFMGYFNNVLQFGIDRFVSRCRQSGVDSCILPDLPVDEYHTRYRQQFEQEGLGINFLVCPQSSDQSIHEAHEASHRFLYLVSSGSTTGGLADPHEATRAYLDRVHAMQMEKPMLVGFGISTHDHFMQMSKTTDGAIIGSAFLRHLSQYNFDPSAVTAFTQSIRNDHSS